MSPLLDPLPQCDEMKNFGINSNFMTNRVVWAPIDREKSNFKKIMSGWPFSTSQNTTFSKIHNFWWVKLFFKRFSDYGREMKVLFYENKKKLKFDSRISLKWLVTKKSTFGKVPCGGFFISLSQKIGITVLY